MAAAGAAALAARAALAALAVLGDARAPALGAIPPPSESHPPATVAAAVTAFKLLPPGEAQ